MSRSARASAPRGGSSSVRSMMVIVTALLALLLLAGPVLATDGDDDGNPPGLVLDIDDSVLSSALQVDGKLLIGGRFTSIGGHPRAGLARLHADGSLDMDFLPGVGNVGRGFVAAISVADDGAILIGGGFTHVIVDGVEYPRKSIARLHGDGSVDEDFAAELMGGSVSSIVMQADGKLVITGLFETIEGLRYYSFARLLPSGALDRSMPPLTTFQIPSGRAMSAALQPDGDILVAGNFRRVQEQDHPWLARLRPDGSLDASFRPDFSSTVNNVAVQHDGRILVGGQGVLKRLHADGSDDPSFTSSSSTVSAISLQADGGMVVTGTFAIVGGAQRRFMGRLDGSGAIQPEPGDLWPDAAVVGTVLDDQGGLFVFGAFTSLDHMPHSRIARLDALPGSGQLVELLDDNDAAFWLREGSLPQLHGVHAEVSTDGQQWHPAGGVAIPDAQGWLVDELDLPRNEDFILRLRGQAALGARNGSVSQHQAQLAGHIAAFTVTPISGGNGSVMPATPRHVDPGHSLTLVAQPDPGFLLGTIDDGCGAGTRTGNTYVTAPIHGDCSITFNFSALPVELGLTLDNQRDHVAYGAALDYQMTVRNTGAGTASGVHVSLHLPADIDVAQTTWTCTASGTGASCGSSGTGAVDDVAVILPPDTSVTWQVHAPVRSDAPDASVVVTAQVDYQAVMEQVADSTLLVLFRDGFSPHVQ